MATIKVLFSKSLIKEVLNFFQIFKYKLRIDRKSHMIRDVKRIQPKKILEIGVHTGDFALRLLDSISTANNEGVHYVGVDLFSEMQDLDNYSKEVSLWAESENFVYEKIKQKFPSVHVQLYTGYSSKILFSLKEKFDIIFIDGGHSFETVKNDWEVSSQSLLKKGGVIYFDDYCNSKQSLKSGFGIKKVVDNIDTDKWSVEFMKISDYFSKDWGILSLKIVKVVEK